VAEQTTAEYAAAHGVSPRTARRHAAAGTLPARWDGRRWLIEQGNPVDDLLASLTPPPSLRIMTDLIQGTDEWHKARLGMVTASVVHELVTPTLKVAANPGSRALAALLVAERITGFTDETFVGYDMERGWADEPRAITAYEKHNSVTVTECGFMVRDEWGFEIGYSPDGLVGADGLLEIKSRRPKKQLQTVLAGEVPAENMAQIQAGLLISGREWCDFISYAGGMRLWTKRVYPDAAWHEAIVEAVRAFEKAAAEMTATYLAAVEGLPMTERIEMDMVI
jgi:hypothetical protein